MTEPVTETAVAEFRQGADPTEAAEAAGTTVAALVEAFDEDRQFREAAVAARNAYLRAVRLSR